MGFRGPLLVERGGDFDLIDQDAQRVVFACGVGDISDREELVPSWEGGREFAKRVALDVLELDIEGDELGVI